MSIGEVTYLQHRISSHCYSSRREEGVKCTSVTSRVPRAAKARGAAPLLRRHVLAKIEPEVFSTTTDRKKKTKLASAAYARVHTWPSHVRRIIVSESLPRSFCSLNDESHHRGGWLCRARVNRKGCATDRDVPLQPRRKRVTYQMLVQIAYFYGRKVSPGRTKGVHPQDNNPSTQ